MDASPVKASSAETRPPRCRRIHRWGHDQGLRRPASAGPCTRRGAWRHCCWARRCWASRPGGCARRTLTLGTKLELNTLDPHFFAAFPTGSSHELLYEKLTFQDKDGAIVPQLATDWRLVDELTWEFRLRPGVKFHDGSAFGAEDVVFTIDRVPNVPNTPNSFAQFTRGIDKVEVVDALTVRLRTKQPSPSIPLDMSNVFIVSSGPGAAPPRPTTTRARRRSGPGRTGWSNGSTASGWWSSVSTGTGDRVSRGSG